jgi:hypothetical protein
VNTILKNVIEFTDLAIGVPASLPHRLNVKGIGVMPKLGGLNAEGFDVTADASDVTVTRTINAASGDVRVYVEYWHTLESVTPLVPPPGELSGLTPFFFAASGQDASPILVEAEGAPLPGAPHSILNFTGAGVTASDAGGGVAEINVPGNALIVADDGVVVPGGPHTAMNFTGTGITATDAGAGVAQITANSVVFVFRPGATGAEAAPPNVFTDWYALMAAIDATKYIGYREIQFDNTYALNPAVDPALAPFLAFNTAAPASVTTPNPLGPLITRYPCAILPPPPGQSWDMRDVIWNDRSMAPGGSSSYIQIWDGGPGRPCLIDNLKRIDSMLFSLVYNGKTVGNHPFVASRMKAQYGWNISGVRTRIYNTDATAQPLFKADMNPCFWDMQNDAQTGNGGALLAPIVEITPTGRFIAYAHHETIYVNNTFTGPVGSQMDYNMLDASAWQDSHLAYNTFLNPTYAGVVTMSFRTIPQRWRPSAVVTPASASKAAFFGDVCQVDSRTGAVIILLPKQQVTAPTTGIFPFSGSAITVIDVGGGEANVVIRAAAGDAINGVLSNGLGVGDIALSASQFASIRLWCTGTIPVESPAASGFYVGGWYVIA